jgi:glycosyltransferase involved in cell wall biosynthesis
MSGKLAYLLGTYFDPRIVVAASVGTYPRPEYLVFLRRNAVKLLSFRDIESSRHPLVQVLRRRGRASWALAAASVAARAGYRGMVTTGEDIGLPLALQARLLGVHLPIFIIMHGSYLRSKKFRLLMAVLRGMDNVHYFCLAETLRRTLVECFGIPATQAHNTSYGVDTQFFRPMETMTSTSVIVSAGTANRDYRTLIRAVAALDVDVKIAADSAWFPARIDLRDAQVPTHVELRSYRDYPSLRNLYASARLVVVPLYPAKHACGYAVTAEAMAMGKPVIATQTDAYGDFIIDGETGYYVPPGDPAALQARIAYLLEHPTMAREMGQRARARIEALFSVEAYCERMERVIHAALPRAELPDLNSISAAPARNAGRINRDAPDCEQRRIREAPYS